jgi:HK97 family phage prohead protease
MNKRLSCDFDIKAKEGGRIVIAGFANANTIDRGIERIEPKAWKLDNFKKNPVILFDHGIDMAFGTLPIGKAIKVEPRDGGLYTEIEISNSKTEKLTAVRDLIEEGILKTFSVGFDPKNVTTDGDVKLITDAELLEISVVPIPMNQDSTFSILSKSMPENRTKTAKRWLAAYQKKARAEVIKETKKQIGCEKVTLLNLKLEKSGFKNSETAKKYAKQYGYASDRMTETENHYVLWQSNEEATDSISINLAAHVIAEIKGQKMGDKKPKDGEIEGNPESTEEGKKSGDINNEDPPKDGETLPKDGEGGDSSIVPKPDLSKEEVDSSISMWHDEAMACANNTEGNPAPWVADEAAWEKAKEAADQSYSREDPEKYYSIVTWLYLNKFGGTKKEPDTQQEGKGCSTDKEEQKQCGDKEKKSAPIPTGADAVDNNTSPLLDLAKQTNVLLGTLISEVQKMNQSFEKLVVKPIESGETEPIDDQQQEEDQNQAGDSQQSNEEMKACIERIRKNQDDLNMRLKRFS